MDELDRYIASLLAGPPLGGKDNKEKPTPLEWYIWVAGDIIILIIVAY